MPVPSLAWGKQWLPISRGPPPGGAPGVSALSDMREASPDLQAWRSTWCPRPTTGPALPGRGEEAPDPAEGRPARDSEVPAGSRTTPVRPLAGTGRDSSRGRVVL